MPIALDSILDRHLTRAHFPGTSRKQVLRDAANLIASRHEQISPHNLFSRLMEREHLGSTGLGHGTAIPHCRSSVVRAPVCAFLKLSAPIDFDAPDGEPVDLMMVLIASEEEHQDHLGMLGASARILGQADNRTSIRACDDDSTLYELLVAME
ncbi:MAG: PTS sugar transporter subunit IIA [Gammaproteobacteria bacterium]|nr:PTS sugar transporter subunit IIA [Gammaproteobacteria bacterium]MCY4198502.1 PTS sugar transporter subunit IIA [Gammaproteobacteria bacterium]MCY4322442.1 PTS sugar transporter subunit IIA [Gammaproteobacteria bacterium]